MIIYIPYNSPIGCILLVFFRSFIGLALTLNFMIHFGLIFMWVMWGQGLGLFIYFLHVSIQLSQHHLLKRLTSLPLNALISLSEINWPSTWGFISFFSVSLIYITLSWWLWLYSKYWNQVVQVIQYSSFSKCFYYCRSFDFPHAF